jgi:hypothetical protein
MFKHEAVFTKFSSHLCLSACKAADIRRVGASYFNLPLITNFALRRRYRPDLNVHVTHMRARKNDSTDFSPVCFGKVPSGRAVNKWIN